MSGAGIDDPDNRVSDGPVSYARGSHGWSDRFPVLRDTAAGVIRFALQRFLPDTEPEQIRAWDDAIPLLQAEVSEVLDTEPCAENYSAILEYELPREARRPDVVLLLSGAVIVLELKGKSEHSQADIDQVAAYARDLRCYHRDCEDAPVHAVLVPTRAHGYLGMVSGVHIAGPDAVDGVVRDLDGPRSVPPISVRRFVEADAYRPLPTLVAAARDLFLRNELPRIRRARAYTDPAVETISQIIHEAARTKTRRLVLLTGVPGAGKTLVGLRIVHAHFLDDLAIERSDGKPPAPAVFLSGNGPLVEVLQYELRGAGGAGKTFVRAVKDYVKTYTRKKSAVPPEHVLVFDEAQRAWDAEHTRRKHRDPTLPSEPEAFIGFAERIPEWCVVVALIGGGQEIHAGEEAGIGQWKAAVQASALVKQWSIHGPSRLASDFLAKDVVFSRDDSLSLDCAVRFHAAETLHEWVGSLLEAPRNHYQLRNLARSLESSGFHLRMTRDRQTAEAYLRARYRENQGARFGLLRSSRDKALEKFGIGQPRRFFPCGPWYGDGEDSPNSCRRLVDGITEFQAQGLELDAVLLAWGTDLLLVDGEWSNSLAKRYLSTSGIRDPLTLRKNAYRVLLTRGRDGTVIFVPPLGELDATADLLVRTGCVVL